MKKTGVPLAGQKSYKSHKSNRNYLDYLNDLKDFSVEDGLTELKELRNYE